MLILAILLFGTEDLAELTLRPNTAKILQRDNLMVTVVLEIKSVSAITIFTAGAGDKFRLELREGDKWVVVGAPQGDSMPGGGLLLMGKSTYAETKHLHVRKAGFLFEHSGNHQLRAIAKMPWGDLESKPVTISVGKRDAGDLKRIEDAKLELGHLAHGVESPMPTIVLALESVGGNMGRTIRERRMTRTLALEEPWKGESVPKEKVCGWLKDKMDPVAYEHALFQLGIFYRQKMNWDGLFRVSQAFEHDSAERRSFEYRLRQVLNPTPPEMP
ncbi:MAG: hypothetical protein ACKVP0_13890 [Pirellulaceae bacterium]